MQSFDSYPDVSDMDLKISFLSFLFVFRNSSSEQTFFDKGYILLRKVSLHDSQNLCTRSVTVIQYKKSIL